MNNLVNYFSSKIIKHNIEILTYIPSNIFIWNWDYYLKWKIDHIALKIHEDIETHNFWKNLTDILDKPLK